MESVHEKAVIVDLAAINERYEAKGIFARLVDMAKGLRRPRDTREHKLALIELQRLAAPLFAVAGVTLFVFVLCVVTAVQTEVAGDRPIPVPVALDPDPPPPDPPEPPPIDIDLKDDVPDVSVNIDMSGVAMQQPLPTAPESGGEPDRTAFAPSPVTMSDMSSTTRLIGIGLGDGGGFGSKVGNGGGQNLEGCLIGTIIDFKRGGDGKKRAEYSADKSYWKDLKRVVDGNFSAAALSRFFVPDKRVALTHLWIPPQTAANGPKSFGVETVMEPSGFAVYYFWSGSTER